MSAEDFLYPLTPALSLDGEGAVDQEMVMKLTKIGWQAVGLPLAIALLAVPRGACAEELKRRGMIGVQLAPLTPEVRQQFNIPVEKGVVFTGIVPNSAAERAGLKGGDVLTKLGDVTIDGLPTFMRTLRKYGAGDTIKFTVHREGGETTADVTLAPRPLETSSDYDIVYDFAGPPGRRVRTVITKPKDAGKYPAVLIIPPPMGSNTVEFVSPAPNPFRTLVADLTKAGFVTMRMDRSSVGDSEGVDVTENTVEGDVQSYRAALQRLSKYEYVNPDRVFVFAHSFGTSIAPSAAAELPVRGIVTFAAFSRSWAEQSSESSIRRWKLEQLSEEEIADNTAKEKLFNQEFFAKKRSPKEILADRPELKKYMDGFIQDETFIFGNHYKYVQELAAVNLPEAWAKVRVPVLAMFGEADFQASKADSELIVSIVNKNAPAKAEFLVVPKTDHGFNQAEDQEESFLAGSLGNRFNPVVMDALLKWLKQQSV